MNSNLIRRISLWLFTALLVLGCALPFLAEPAPAQLPATQSSEILGTSIVETAAAAQTLTVTFLPSPTSTLTPTLTRIPTVTQTPTPTFIYSLFTATFVPTETSTVSVSSAGGTAGGADDGTNGTLGFTEDGYKFTGKEWTCTVTAKSPGKGAVVKQGQTIYASWTVVNTGTKTWTNNGVDFRYQAGLRMDGRKIQDLPRTVAPGNKITLTIQLTAPKRSETYATTWTLKVGIRTFCPMKITFDALSNLPFEITQQNLCYYSTSEVHFGCAL